MPRRRAPTVPVATRLPPDLVEKLDRIAAATGRTRSEALRDIAREFEPPVTLDAQAPLFVAALPAPSRAKRVRFAETRYDHVAAASGRRRRS